jgi:antitoxin component of MazEF toxin-antitoxin module
MQERIVKVSFNKSGGTARGNAVTNRVTIPTSWIKQLGITEEDREIKLILEDDKIIIEKLK